MKSAFSRSLMVAVFSLTFSILHNNVQAAMSYDEVFSLIKQIRAAKQVTPDVGKQVSQILQGLLDNDGVYYAENQDLKQKFFASMSEKRMLQYSSAMNSSDARVLMLMYYTKQGIPDNLTDSGLRKTIAGHGASLKANTVKNYFAKKQLTPSIYNTLENFPPDVAAKYVDILSNPWFVIGKKPVGAPGGQETYASDSLFAVVYAIREVEFAKRSVVVKLLDNMGKISIPSSVDATFDWSGNPDITIDLSFTPWTVADIPALQALLGNSYYAVAAQQQLDKLQH